jgi:hypothetical protein
MVCASQSLVLDRPVEAVDNGGYLMINQIEIRNFRCFEHVKLTGLKRFNFFVGESGTGKTAFIESLFLVGSGNPEIWFRLRRWRGLGEGPVQLGVREAYESLFRDMFYKFNQKAGTYLRIIDSSKGKRELEIYYDNVDVLNLPIGNQKDRENAFAVDFINFKWDFGSRVVHSKVEVRDGALRMTGNAEVYPIFLVSPRTFSGRETAQFYSNLSRTKRAEPVLAAIQALFKNISEVSLEMVAGEPLLHVSMPDLKEKLPLGDISGGLSKYVEILIAILTNPGGAVLIDEIENGFYFKNMPDLLKNLVAICNAHQVQIFATTHSYEFLQTIAESMSSSARGVDDFAIFRLEKEMFEPPTFKLIEGDSFHSAIENSFEVR